MKWVPVSKTLPRPDLCALAYGVESFFVTSIFYNAQFYLIQLTGLSYLAKLFCKALFTLTTHNSLAKLSSITGQLFLRVSSSTGAQIQNSILLQAVSFLWQGISKTR